MAGVGGGPAAHLLEARDEADARRPIVDVDGVEHLDPGPLPRRIGQRPQPRPLPHERVRVQPALGIREEIELEPARTLPVELPRDRCMAVGEELVVVARPLDRLLVDVLLGLRDLALVGVVGADDLRLVHPHRGCGRRAQQREQRERREGDA
jgi:hypothetical protein